MILGQIVMTRGISECMNEDMDFAKEIEQCFDRYLDHEWGDLCDEDIDSNDRAIIYGNDRILARYQTTKGSIYIITEADHSSTTILFTDEY